MKFNPSILDYLGKLDIGILVLISIVYNNKYYESTFFYTSDQMILTLSEDLDQDLGYDISEDPEYPILIKNILSRLIPYNEMYSRLDDVDFNKYKPDLNIDTQNP